MSIKIEQLQRKTAATASSVSPSGTREKWWNRDIPMPWKTGLSTTDKMDSYKQLAILLEAGLDLQKGLSLMLKDLKPGPRQKVFNTVREQLIQGASFSEALAHTQKFSRYEVYSIHIGEESGKLLQVLNALHDYYYKSRRFRQQLISALSYPGFVLFFSFLVILFMFRVLIPMFSDVYRKMGSDLPVITTRILDASAAFSKYGPWCLALLSVLGVFIWWQRKENWWRSASSQVLRHLPVIGPIVKVVVLGRFAQSMALLLQSRIPLMTAVDLVRKMMGHYPMEKALEQVSKSLYHGAPLETAMKASPMFPGTMIAMVEVGEASGKLDQMFQELARQYEEELNHRTSVIGAMIEPILIVVLGGIVGFILIAMYLPIFQMGVGGAR